MKEQLMNSVRMEGNGVAEAQRNMTTRGAVPFDHMDKAAKLPFIA